MAQTDDKWRLQKAYPPMRMVDYIPLRQRIVAEWLHCAGLTCEQYDLTRIAEMVEAAVLDELRQLGPWRAVRELTRKEDD